MLSQLLATDPELAARAHAIAALLRPGRVVVSCKHARSFVPGLLGAWLAGATVELLPNVQPATLDRVDADPDVAFVLHDDPARQGRSPKAIYVPDVAPGGKVAAALPLIAVKLTTSGTTERPKYVEKTMAHLLGELDVLARVIAPARCVLSTVPLSHLYGLLFGALLPLRTGARIASHDALLPADVAAVIEREGVDLMISTPAHLRAMANAPMPRGLRVISSGARMPADLHMRLALDHGWHVTDVLGSTETGGIATRDQPVHAWRPLPGVEVSAPAGQMTVESPWSARVELDDRIELRADGRFDYVGRTSELVKIAGKRAHAHAIEATVREVPGVADAAVIVHAPDGREPRIALAYTGSADREQIAAAVRAQFDAVFVPRIMKAVASIPRSERGKLDGEALRDLLGLAREPAVAEVPIRQIAPGRYEADIPRDLVFFRGHFDAFTILPGAVLVERVVWPAAQRELPEHSTLRGIRRLRFRRPVFPDQQLAISVKHDPGRVVFEVSTASQVVASGQLLVG
jgi:acyl-CoA synthetase (AMP-forming)/AMP-acid ligase II/3-hydroxymyristoyl/3-hydroxydecanoyl-(acyl carrier protein) dehydratase